MPISSSRGLVGQWAFDEGRGSQAGDSSQSRNTGTLSGTTLPTWTNGKRGKALSFDGSTSYVSVSSTSTLPTGQGARTVSAWVYQRSRTLETASAIVDILNGGSGQSFTFTLALISATNCINAGASPNIFLFTDSVNSNNNICITGSQIPSLNAWHHIILTFDGGTAFTYYLDGVSSLSGNFGTTINTHTSGVNIGRRSSAVTGYTDAILDDVRIFNRALSASEAYALYKNGAVQAAVSQNSRLTNGLVGMWSFNGPDYNSASTTAEVLDRSGSGNNGDNIGATRVGGKVGQALQFNGTTNYVSVSMSSSPIMTISFWGKVGTPSANENFGIAFHDATTGLQKLSVVLNDAGELGVASSFNAWQRMKNGFTTLQNDGKWHLFSFVVNKSDYTQSHVYLDGSEVSSYTTQANTTFNSDDRLYMNRINVPSASRDDYATGALDEVRIYNRALTASEVYQLYNLGR
jgi:hypothetical protein